MKCGAEVPDGPYCLQCGTKQERPARNVKRRGNGTGCVYQLANGKYVCEKTLGYYLDKEGKKHRKSIKRRFDKRKDAVNALPLLGLDQTAAGKADKKAKTTLKQLYDLWLPTHDAGSSTLGNYKAAFNYFKPLYAELAADIDIDDLQNCIDDCPRGKATRRNMRTVVGLIYKYGIPRGYFPEKLDLSSYLNVDGASGVGGTGLPDLYLDQIRKAMPEHVIAKIIYAHCYLGFRPSELLNLKVSDYDTVNKAFTGGSKTEAGIDRVVTISPKVQPIVNEFLHGKKSGYVFTVNGADQMNIKTYRALFYNLLEDLHLENPTFEVNGQQKHTYTPHSCRHTFATLMKRVPGSSKDKLALIGHTSEEMLQYYQDVSLEDRRKITDLI